MCEGEGGTCGRRIRGHVGEVMHVGEDIRHVCESEVRGRAGEGRRVLTRTCVRGRGNVLKGKSKVEGMCVRGRGGTYV